MCAIAAIQHTGQSQSDRYKPDLTRYSGPVLFGLKVLTKYSKANIKTEGCTKTEENNEK